MTEIENRMHLEIHVFGKAGATDFFSVHTIVNYSFIPNYDSFQMCSFSYVPTCLL